ncbi:MAG: uracil-DNA glycosylase family protein [Candidatus Syntrophosphaera sp.]|nr:uracil-DNA glycosylase family protein [Candidatus Syntrophosphaera sp.]
MPEAASGLIQSHPYRPYVPDQARTLILGSVPPWRFCTEMPKPLSPKDMDYYYGSHVRGCNLLWEVLFRVLDPAALPELQKIRELQLQRVTRTEKQRVFLQDFLARHGLGIADILLRFERRDLGSADAKIRPLEFTDLTGILASRLNLANILCTSKKVDFWLREYLATQGIALESEHGAGAAFPLPDHDEASLTERRIRVLILPSPSPVGRVRFPNHVAFVDHLTQAYTAVFSSLSDQ